MAKKKQNIAAKKSAPKTNISTKQTATKKAASHVEAPAIEQETAVETLEVNIDPAGVEIEPAQDATEQEETAVEQDPIVSTNEPVKKSRKSKLGDEISIKLVGCSYHYFRRFFKKRFAAENIKVRFVKQATGYNGHVEIAEATKTEALALLEQIKTDNPTVRNLFWEL